MSSKGLELPINVIVIVAIAVLVLVVAAALFSSQFGAGVTTINLETAYQRGCTTLRTVYGCVRGEKDDNLVNKIKIADYPEKGSSTSLNNICLQKFKDVEGDKITACVRQCGCP